MNNQVDLFVHSNYRVLVHVWQRPPPKNKDMNENLKTSKFMHFNT